MNYFLIANAILCLGAGVYYLIQGQTPLGLIQITYVVSNLLFLWQGLK
jgi:hypothetical protein